MLAGHGHVGERNDQLAAFDPVLHQIEPPHGDAKVPRGGQHREIGAVELHAFTVGIQPSAKCCDQVATRLRRSCSDRAAVCSGPGFPAHRTGYVRRHTVACRSAPSIPA